MNLIFRRMIPDDISVVYEMECVLFPDPWPEKNFIHEVNEIKVSYPFIVEINEQIVGYIICWYCFNELHIGNIAVIESWQREGIGKFILTKTFDYFRDYEVAYLEVRESNHPAINLYTTFGFRATYRKRQYYPNGEDAIVMIKYRENYQ